MQVARARGVAGSMASQPDGASAARPGGNLEAAFKQLDMDNYDDDDDNLVSRLLQVCSFLSLAWDLRVPRVRGVCLSVVNGHVMICVSVIPGLWGVSCLSAYADRQLVVTARYKAPDARVVVVRKCDTYQLAHSAYEHKAAVLMVLSRCLHAQAG
jgi:hypothetical protein